VNGGNRLLPLFLISLFLAALAGALSNIAGPHAYLPRLLYLGSIVTLLAFLYRGRHEIVFILLKARRVSEPGPATTWILAGLVFLVAALVLDRVAIRYDATSRGLNRLSAASRAVLGSLDKPIEMIGVFRETSGQRDRAIDVLEIYRSESSRIHTRMLDPDRQPDEARRLGLTRSGVIAIRAGAVKEEAEDVSEESVTQAILRAEYPGRSRVAFVIGHEERSIQDGSALGLSRFAAVLRQNGYEPTEVNLVSDDVPADAAALAIIGARRPLFPGEIDRVGQYLDRGGRLLLCMDPGTDIGLTALLRGRGIVIDSLEIYDEGPATQSLGMGPRTLVVTDYPRHPIIPGAGMGYTVFSGARRIAPSPEPVWGINEKILLSTSRQSHQTAVGGLGPTGGTRAQNQPIGIAEEWEVAGTGQPAAGLPVAEKPYARLVVIGDSDWLSAQFLDLFSNRELAVRTTSWLAEREFLLKIPPMDMRGTPLRIGLGGLRTLFYFLQVGLPLALLMTGLWIWSRRR